MVQSRIESRKQKFANKREPVQQRSRQRRDDILATTGRLLERAGLDDLTTILIAREMNISVGSLYHYFPNKQAILYAMGEHWLEEQTQALEELAAQPLETLDVPAFVSLSVDRFLRVYKAQRGLLPLVQAMWSIPELWDLDERHDELVIGYLADMFRRLGLSLSKPERERKGRLMLELIHALLLTIVEQPPAKASRSLRDLKALTATLLQT